MLKKAIALLVMIAATFAFQSPALAKGGGKGGGASKSSSSSTKSSASTDSRGKKPHGAQGTGNYKGKKDRHEKPGPQNEKKKKKSNWSAFKKNK